MLTGLSWPIVFKFCTSARSPLHVKFGRANSMRTSFALTLIWTMLDLCCALKPWTSTCIKHWLDWSCILMCVGASPLRKSRSRLLYLPPLKSPFHSLFPHVLSSLPCVLLHVEFEALDRLKIISWSEVDFVELAEARKSDRVAKKAMAAVRASSMTVKEFAAKQHQSRKRPHHKTTRDALPISESDDDSEIQDDEAAKQAYPLPLAVRQTQTSSVAKPSAFMDEFADDQRSLSVTCVTCCMIASLVELPLVLL